MTRINLLPWRQRRRDQRQRNFLITLGLTVVFAGLIVVGAHFVVMTLIDGQEARNQYLRTEIARINRVEKEIRAMQENEQRLLDRLDAIKRLQQSRPDMVKVLDNLVRLLPEDVFLTSLTAREKALSLRGDARLNNVVSDFMRELDQSPLFGEPRLKVIENQRLAGGIPISVFDLDVGRTGSEPATFGANP